MLLERILTDRFSAFDLDFSSCTWHLKWMYVPPHRAQPAIPPSTGNASVSFVTQFPPANVSQCGRGVLGRISQAVLAELLTSLLGRERCRLPSVVSAAPKTPTVCHSLLLSPTQPSPIVVLSGCLCLAFIFKSLFNM